MPHTRPARSFAVPRGFTIVELMVSLVLFSVAVAGVLSVAVTLSSAFRDQRAIISTESAARSPMDFLSDVLRNASPGVQNGQITDYSAQPATVACTAPSAMTVTNNAAGPIPAAGTDAIDVIYASGAVVTSSRLMWDNSTNQLPVFDASGIAPGDYIILTNTTTGIFIKVIAVVGNTLTLANPTCLTNVVPGTGYPSGSIVIRAMHAKFYVDANFEASVPPVVPVPGLMMQLDPNSAAPPAPQPLSDGVEDLQLALGMDWILPPDNAISELGAAPNDDEWIFNKTGDTMQVGPVRSIRLTLVARAVNGNAGTNNLTFNRPAAEDHAVGGADGFRRRVLQTTVEIRNFGGSP